MSTGKRSLLVCASLALAAQAHGEEAPFVTRLELPARSASEDVFAWRVGDDIEVERSVLVQLGVASASGEGRVALRSVPGLSYREDAARAAILLTCDRACFAVQTLGAPEPIVAITQGRGGYFNYDVEAQWRESTGADLAGVIEGVVFGHWGLAESSWLAQSDDGVTRLETRLTFDRPRDQIRLRVGDSTTLGVGGAPTRFGGVEIGRHFGLAPSMITYPTPALAGEADTASTVELYVDGALRSRDRIAAGPFAFEHAPVVSGAGEAQLVVTDVLGRQQIISRPFFVSTTMLRPGLTDWTVAAGAERLRYAQHDAEYGRGFVSGRYRRGISDTFTAEGAVQLIEDETATWEVAGAYADAAFGQVRLALATNGEGAATSYAWFRDARGWSLGLQGETRDTAFEPLGRSDSRLRSSAALSASLDVGDQGSLGLTAAEARFNNEAPARTFALSMQADQAFGAISLRLAYTEQEEEELLVGLSFSMSLRGDASANVGVEHDERGATYRASAHRPADPDEVFGWRARVSAGAAERVDLGLTAHTRAGDSRAQLAWAEGEGGARLGHSGSFGWIEGTPFAGRSIEGAFALIDTGAAGVDVLRDRFDLGATDEDGRLLATNLRPYDRNVISLDAEDLPLDRAALRVDVEVAPMQGAGVLVRFTQATEQLQETSVRYASGESPARGAILVRVRDRTRFPVGTNGRVVITGAIEGDVLELEGAACVTPAGPQAVANALQLTCSVS